MAECDVSSLTENAPHITTLRWIAMQHTCNSTSWPAREDIIRPECSATAKDSLPAREGWGTSTMQHETGVSEAKIVQGSIVDFLARRVNVQHAMAISAVGVAKTTHIESVCLAYKTPRQRSHRPGGEVGMILMGDGGCHPHRLMLSCGEFVNFATDPNPGCHDHARP